MSQRYVLRLLAFSFFLLLALPAQGVVATGHGATTDDGSSGGGLGSGIVSDVPVLVGSGPEREIVATGPEIIVASEYDEQQGRPYLTAGSETASSPERSEAEMIRGDLSPVVTEEVAGVAVQPAASDEPAFARAGNELTINGVRVE